MRKKSKTRTAPMRTSPTTIPNANISACLLAGRVPNNSYSVAFVRLHTSKIFAPGIDASTWACPWSSIRILGSKNVSYLIGCPFVANGRPTLQIFVEHMTGVKVEDVPSHVQRLGRIQLTQPHKHVAHAQGLSCPPVNGNSHSPSMFRLASIPIRSTKAWSGFPGIVRRLGVSTFSRQLLPHKKADNNVNFAGKNDQTTDITHRKGIVLCIRIRIWVVYSQGFDADMSLSTRRRTRHTQRDFPPFSSTPRVWCEKRAIRYGDRRYGVTS